MTDSLTGNSITANHLTSISAVAQEFGISNPLTSDQVYSFFNTCIGQSSTKFENDVDTVLANQKLVGYYDVFPRTAYNELELRNFPIITINSLKVRSNLNDSWTDITSDIDESSIGNDKIILKTKSFPIGQATVQVNYNAGYVSIPQDLEQACKEDVKMTIRASNFTGLGKNLLGENSKTVNTQAGSTTFNYDFTKVSDAHKKVLDNYRKYPI